MGQDMIDELVDTYNCFVESFVTGGKGQKKDELIRFLITSFEHEQIVMPRGDENSRNKMDILESELSKFCAMTTPAGNEKFQGVGSHDDTVMSLALANRATQVIGIPFAVTTGSNTSSAQTQQYDAFVQLASGKESDLVKQIRMGLIK